MVKMFVSVRWVSLVVFGSWSLAAARAATWEEILGKPGEPRLLVFSNLAEPPAVIPFIPERKKATGVWTDVSNPGHIGKLAETAVAEEKDGGMAASGYHLHVLGADQTWTSLPVCESSPPGQGGLMAAEKNYRIHEGFWKAMQASRPEAGGKAAAGGEARTGKFVAELGDRPGGAVTPDDPKKVPLIDFNGNPDQEKADVVVPKDYDGSKPFGLFVFIMSNKVQANPINGAWEKDFARLNMIYVGPQKCGNDNPANRRVWLAQQARAWALHHYRIDPNRMVIAGHSNGADAASATTVATPFGFNGAVLLSPPCGPPVGPVGVPQSSNNTGMVIEPLSAAGLRHIKNQWRIVHSVAEGYQFEPNVRASAAQVEDFDFGNLLDVHPKGKKPDMAAYLEFLDQPRVAKGNGANPGAANPAIDAALARIKTTMATDMAGAKTQMIQLWTTRPDARGYPKTMALLEEMEAVPTR